MIKRELLRFSISGASSVAIAYIIYRTLVYGGMNNNVSYGVAYVIGLSLSYLVNKLWTFESKISSRRTFMSFSLLQIITLLASTIVNSKVLAEMQNTLFVHELAFVFGIATSTTLNFIGLKYFVFRSSP